jgi:peptide/nickel transport system substrate-binding protein
MIHAPAKETPIPNFDLCLFLIFLAALSGCTGHLKTPDDTLIVAIESQPTNLDPRFATDANSVRIDGLIFESLVHVGEGFRPEPEVAQRWEAHGNVLKFYLRPDLKFHNGRAVTPEDILFSFECYRAPGSPFASSLAVIDSIQAQTENGRIVVTLKLSRFSDKFLVSDLPIVKILPKAEIERLGRDYASRLIGTGPFAYIKTDLNEIRLKSVRAKIPFLTFKVIRDDYTRYQKLLKGEVDFVQAAIPTDKVKDFENRPDRFEVFRYPGLTMTYVLLNFKDPILKQKTVRLALARSLKRKDIIDYKLDGLALEATSLLTPDNPYFNKALRNPPFNINAAREQIEKLGLKGRKLVLKTSNSPQAIDNGKVLANQMSQTGLDVDLQSYEWGTFYSDVKKGLFQLATMKWVGLVDPDIYELAFHSREVPPGRNRGSYLNAKLDELLDRANRVATRDQRRKIFDRVQEIVLSDLAVLPLWYDIQVAIVNRRITGFKPSMNSDFSPLAKVGKTSSENQK